MDRFFRIQVYTGGAQFELTIMMDDYNSQIGSVRGNENDNNERNVCDIQCKNLSLVSPRPPDLNKNCVCVNFSVKKKKKEGKLTAFFIKVEILG